jgi:hypothetical protein
VALASIAGALLGLAILFLVQLALAPRRQRDEARRSHRDAMQAMSRIRTEAEELRVAARAKADARVAGAEQERDTALRRAEAVQLAPHAVGLDDALAAERAAGKRLLAEAASLEPAGNLGLLDDLLRRNDTWVDRVSDALTDHDEPEMRERWTNDLRWNPSRPMPITRDQIDRYVVGPIRERLDLMREFQRELRERDKPDAEFDSVRLVGERYRIGRELQPRLVWPDEGAPTSKEEAIEAQRRARDLVREWAQETWPILLKHFPTVEREFYGPGHSLGEQGFWRGFDEEMRGGRTPQSYLESKLRILESFLQRVDR